MKRKFLCFLTLIALSLTIIAGNVGYISAEEDAPYVPTGTIYDNDGVYFRDTATQRIGLIMSNFDGMAIQSKLTQKSDAPATASTDIFGMVLNVNANEIDSEQALVFEYETFVNAALYFSIILTDDHGNVFTIKAKSAAYRMNDLGIITPDGLNTIEYKINNIASGWMGQQNPAERFKTTYIVPFSSFICNAVPATQLHNIASVKYVYSFGAGSTYQLKAVIGTLKTADFTVDGTDYIISQDMQTIFEPVGQSSKASEGTDFDYYISVAESEPKTYFDIVPLLKNEWFFRDITIHDSSSVDVLFPAELTNNEGFIDISSLEGMIINAENLTSINVGFRLAIWDDEGTKWSALRTGASLAIPNGISPENNYDDIYWRRTGNIPANFKGKILIPFSAEQDNPVFTGGTTAFPNLCSKTYNAVRMYFTNQENVNADLIVNGIEFITNLKDYVSTVNISAENGTVETDRISYEGMIAVKTGEEISLMLTPNEGYEIRSITINDVEQDVNITNYTYTVLDDINIVATFDLSHYTITYHLNGGTNDEENPATYTIMTKTITFIDPVKEGDTFLGWYTNSDFSGEEITSIPRGSNGNVELYAKWTSNKTSNNDKTSKGCGKASTSFLSLLMILVPAVIFFKKR